MASKRKLFRYAASLIFATRQGYGYAATKDSTIPLAILKHGSQQQRIAQMSPHVIQQQGTGHVKGIDVLFVQRSTESGFMPDSHVFPGGVLDEADFSTEWLDLFPKEAQHSMENVLVKKPPSERLPLYSGVPDNCIIGELAFRICAIRETFEETGILLARPMESASQMVLGTQAPHYQLLKSIGEEWRKRVCDDASNFVQLFREIRCVPDVWSLIEWSNWLTPENISRRYDTIFYLCCLEGKPSPTFNPSEVSKAEWLSVEKTLDLNTQQQLTLPPPQLTELSNINLLPTMHHLHLYGLYQNMFASRVCLLPRRLFVDFTNQAGNLLYSLLPGDDLYPVETNPNTYQCANKSFKLTLKQSDHPLYEFTSTAKDSSHMVTHKMHRMMLEQMVMSSYIDTVNTNELNSIVSDIDDCIVPNSKL